MYIKVPWTAVELAKIHKFQLPVASYIRQGEPLYNVDPPPDSRKCQVHGVSGGHLS